jgi:hypothetical protein
MKRGKERKTVPSSHTYCRTFLNDVHFLLTTIHKGASIGRAIAQAVSRRLPTVAARVQNRVWSYGIL